jgi:hypothetical protein
MTGTITDVPNEFTRGSEGSFLVERGAESCNRRDGPDDARPMCTTRRDCSIGLRRSRTNFRWAAFDRQGSTGRRRRERTKASKRPRRSSSPMAPFMRELTDRLKNGTRGLCTASYMTSLRAMPRPSGLRLPAMSFGRDPRSRDGQNSARASCCVLPRATCAAGSNVGHPEIM